ncbi:MAG: hypothetical protein KY431_10435 [Actinobacteria bacterium]|nr:hypothetical protein [Actinomycetota bacterium]
MSTAPHAFGPERLRRARWGRRAFFVAITLFLALGALGRYDMWMGEASGTGGGYELTVRYAEVSRPGLATPWSLELRRAGGFGTDTVSVATTSSYLDIFEGDPSGAGVSR